MSFVLRAVGQFVLACLVGLVLGAIMSPLCQAATRWTGVSQTCSSGGTGVCPTVPGIAAFHFVSDHGDCRAFSEGVFSGMNGNNTTPTAGAAGWWSAYIYTATSGGSTRTPYYVTDCSVTYSSGTYSASVSSVSSIGPGNPVITMTHTFTGVDIASPVGVDPAIFSQYFVGSFLATLTFFFSVYGIGRFLRVLGHLP